MRTMIIVNPAAGRAEELTTLLSAFEADGELAVRESGGREEVRRLTTEAIAEGYEQIVAAGGDGTVNELINALAPDFARVRFGVLPLGTGNDLARSLAMPEEPIDALRALLDDREHQVDLVRATYGDGMVRYAVNAAAAGLSGEISHVITPEMKQRFGPLAFVFSAAEAIRDCPVFDTSLWFEHEEEPERIDALGVIAANGSTVGGGRRIAPRSRLDDGKLDVITIRSGSGLDMAGAAARLIAGDLLPGDFLDSELVSYRQATRVRIAAEPAMAFNMDGELVGETPVELAILPRVLRMAVGPEFFSESE